MIFTGQNYQETKKRVTGRGLLTPVRDFKTIRTEYKLQKE